MHAASRPSVATALVFVSFAFVFHGCADVYRIKVDAEARPDAAEHVAYSIADESGFTQPRAQTDASREYVRTALSAKGMYEAPTAAQVELEVVYAYRIEAHHGFRTVSEPVYRTRSGGTSQETETVYDENGKAHTEIVTRRNPDIQVMTDLVDKRVPEITYEKQLHILATEKKSAGANEPPRVWDISISYDDLDPDLEKAMPLLAAAGCDRIGTDTHGPVVVRLRGKDEVVEFIKRGM